MKIIKVSDLKPGMCFSMPVYIDPYNKILDKEMPVTHNTIGQLIEWKVKEIHTDGYELEMKKIDTKTDDNTEVVGTYSGTDSSSRTATDRKKLDKKFSKKKKNKKLVEELSTQSIIPKENIPINILRLYKHAKELVKNSILIIKNHKPLPKQDIYSMAERINTALEEDKLSLLKLIFRTQREYDYVEHLYNQHVDTCVFSLLIGKALNLDLKTRMDIGASALVHDFGMFMIPQIIIQKYDSLTEEEYMKVKTHPFLGFKVLSQVGKMPREVARVSLHHQELYDGSGYPKGLSGSQIDYNARIVSVASVYAALIKVRSYRESITPSSAITKMVRELKSKFDPKILNAFISTIGIYPPSSLVILNKGWACIVLESNPRYPKRPKIQMLYDKKGLPPEIKSVVDLSLNDRYNIEKVLTKFEFEKLIVERHEKLQQ